MKEFAIALRIFVVFTVLTGIIYPLAVTVVSQALYPHQANGSMIREDGKLVGSTLIGRQYEDPGYFWGRPSHTANTPYDATASSGSNLGPTNPALLKAIAERVSILSAADPSNGMPIPTDLVTSSGSGLDPHISVAAAEFQIPRIARLRGIPEIQLKRLVRLHTKNPDLGLFGEPVVNVQQLNLAMDHAKSR